MNLQFDLFECKISNRQREGYIQLHECNFYKILDISRQFFACFKGISLATLDQLYTASVSESWLSDEDQYYTVPHYDQTSYHSAVPCSRISGRSHVGNCRREQYWVSDKSYSHRQ